MYKIYRTIMSYNKKVYKNNNDINDINIRKYTQGKKCNREEFTNSHWDNINNYIFNIEDKKYEEFLDEYTKDIIKNDNFGKFCYMEKPCNVGPLYFDFDVKVKNNTDKIFTKKDYINLIKITNKIISNNFKIENNKLLESYVFKKPDARKIDDECYSDGFHIHYPNLILNVTERYFIFDKVKDKVLKKGIFEHIKSKIINSIDENFFDPRIIKTNSWFLYGSGKKENNIVYYYKLKYVFNESLEILEIDKNDIKHLVSLFSIRNKGHLRDISYKKNIKKELDEIELKYIKKKKIAVDDFFVKKNNDTVNGNENTSTNIQNNVKTGYNYNWDDINEAKKLVKLLGSKRANSYESWLNVGWALYNISSVLLNEFIEFSKTATRKNAYQDGCCEKVWKQCIERNSTDGFNLPSLSRWAKEDNGEGFAQYKLDKINKILDQGDIKTDFDVATIIYEYYKHDFICSSIKKNSWFQFFNHRWNVIEDGYGLSLKISREMPQEFAKLYSYYISKSVTGKQQENDTYLKKAKEINIVILNLKNKTYKDRIIAEASNLFYDKNFIRLLNQNPYLVGFNNGTFDLKIKKFRDGQPEDLISKSCGYDYVEFKGDEPVLKNIEDFYDKIQPSPDVNLLLKCYAASFFESGNKDQKIALMIGVGSNGKGTWFDLIDGTLGEYYATISSTVFTQKRGSSSNATPELANKYDTRALGFQEIDSDDKFHMGLLKSMTGQDKMEVRPLYGDPFSYIPQYKIFAAMNVEPNIESDDNGTWRRILKIDFPTIFKSNPKKPNERKGDPDIREKIKGWYQGHSWLLLNKYYKIYKDNGGIENLIPESVKMSVEKYKNDSNIFLEFFSENINADQTSKLEKSTLWLLFKEWYIESYNSKTNVPNKKLFGFFEKNGYKIDKGANGYIHGIKLRENELEPEI
jgi:P4 family phage/plasmid primase-like protien